MNSGTKEAEDDVITVGSVGGLRGGLRPPGALPAPLVPHVAAPEVVEPTALAAAITELMRILQEFAGFKQTDYMRRKLEHTFRSARPLEVWELVTRIAGSRSGDDLAALVENLTNHETYFFRDRPQLDVLAQSILPGLIESKAASGQRRLRIWSAACATGEEPYSLAMLVVQAFLDRKLAYEWAPGEVRMPQEWSVEILGSDISRQAVRVAREASYSKSALASFRQFPPQFLRFFNEGPAPVVAVPRRTFDSGYRAVKDCIRGMVRIERANLMDAHPPWHDVDLLLCRNALIYIDASKQAGIETMFARSLRQGGVLMLSPVDNVQRRDLFKETWFDRCLIHERK